MTTDFSSYLTSRAHVDMSVGRPAEIHRYIADGIAPARQTYPATGRRHSMWFQDVDTATLLPPMSEPVLRRRPVWREYWDCGDANHLHKSRNAAAKCCQKQVRKAKREGR